LHLHARSIQFVGAQRKLVTITAPLPPHMAATIRNLGLEEKSLVVQEEKFAGKLK
jgi:hypothetical protein